MLFFKPLLPVLVVFSFLFLGCASTIPDWSYTNIPPASHINHPTLIPIWIDSNFTPSQVQEIRQAIHEWDWTLNGQVVLQLQVNSNMGVDHHRHDYPATFTGWEAGEKLQKECEKSNIGWVIYDLAADDPHIADKIGPGTLAFVEGYDENAIFVIGDRLGTRSLKDIIMHEMAHLLGASHVNTGSLEFPYYSPLQYTCIDKITAMQVATYRHLDFEAMNYCVTPNLR